jgi:hypothetical protein
VTNFLKTKPEIFAVKKHEKNGLLHAYSIHSLIPVEKKQKKKKEKQKDKKSPKKSKTDKTEMEDE